MEEKNNKNPLLVKQENGHIRVKNFSAYWLEEITTVMKIHGTKYVVDGTYEGLEPLPSKLKRILLHEEKEADDE